MADQIDLAQHFTEIATAAAIRAARQPVVAGVPGNCSECGDDMPRLVNGLCAPCREPSPRIPRRF